MTSILLIACVFVAGAASGAILAAYIAYRDAEDQRRELDGMRVLMRWLLTNEPDQDDDSVTATPISPSWYGGIYVETDERVMQ